MAVTFRQFDQVKKNQVVDLFSFVFEASEGKEAGAVIRLLAENLLTTTASEDLFVYNAYDQSELTGSIIFSRMHYNEDDRSVFLLSPLAIKTNRQNEGLGQALIRFGLEQLRNHGGDVVITYGSPDFYGKSGFEQISEKIAKPPYKLERSYGWQAISLTEDGLTPLMGNAKCVSAFDNPEYW